ncbi:MAG TPA: hypothetical protein VLJ76_01320 [Gaiellaceae bacterium]|nr:hypothetical protein [Gaiellaceae bacterium]
MNGTSFGTFFVFVIIDAGIATLVFRHAHLRGNPRATAWGVFTFLATGIALPLYFANYWFRNRRRG